MHTTLMKRKLIALSTCLSDVLSSPPPFSLSPSLFSYACASSLVAMFLILKFLVENFKYSIAYSAAPSACCCIPFACALVSSISCCCCCCYGCVAFFLFPLFTFHFSLCQSILWSTFLDFISLLLLQTNNSGRILVQMRIQIPHTAKDTTTATDTATDTTEDAVRLKELVSLCVALFQGPATSCCPRYKCNKLALTLIDSFGVSVTCRSHCVTQLTSECIQDCLKGITKA